MILRIHHIAVTLARAAEDTVPTLIVIGSEDGLLPDARALSGQMANHELVVLDGENHVNTDVSGAFLNVLQAFLTKHTPGKLETERKK